jgi:phage terminase large subunit-like protein
MGLRGPGAKPVRKASEAPEHVPEAMPWEAPGLSRLERVVAFLEALPITSGMHAGRPFKVRDWQRDILAAIYAERDGVRAVRTAVVSCARKQGKTDITARLALCHLAGPEAEPRGEVYSAANDRFQASRIFSEMAAMVERVPWLSERITIRRHAKEMEDLGGTGSVYAALSADVATKMGLSPSFVAYDELGQAPKRDLFDALDTAMGARSEPLMVVISTQAATDTAPLSELIDYGLKVRAGEIDDPAFHLALYTAPPDLDPWDPETWKLANPALGDFRSLADVERQAAQARAMPAKEASFRNLILNQRIDAADCFITRAAWSACADPLRPVEGRPVWAGLDLGGARDLTALVMAFGQDDGTFDLVPVVWVPGDLREREAIERAPYPSWAQAGFVRRMEARTMDPRLIARDLAELHGRYGFSAVACDRWKLDDLKRELDAIGSDLPLVPHGQGFRDMAPAVDALERLVAERHMRHAGHPVLTMCAACAVVERDPAGNRKLSKAKSTGRIDAIVAAAMAVNIAAKVGKQEAWEPWCEAV